MIDGLFHAACPEVAPRTILGSAKLIFKRQDGGFRVFTVKTLSSWIIEPYDVEASAYYWDWLDPVLNVKIFDVAVVNIKHCFKMATLLRHYPQCIQAAVMLHEVAHGVVQALLPAQSGWNPRSTHGRFTDEELTWQIAWKIRDALPSEYTKFATPLSWEAARCFGLGTYYNGVVASGESVSFLPEELRRVILEEAVKLWDGGIAVMP